MPDLHAAEKAATSLPAAPANMTSPPKGVPFVLGVIGAIGAGKSTVARMFAEAGCQVFDADRVGHEVLADSKIVRRLVAAFGNEILNAQGAVDRGKVAQQVFADATKRRQLEELVHPAIRDRFEAAKDAAQSQGAPILILEAPVLLEADWQDACNALIFVDAPRAMRQARLRSRGWDEAELARREAAQWPNDIKRTYAQFHLRNDGSLEACRRQVDQILHRVRQSTSKESPHG